MLVVFTDFDCPTRICKLMSVCSVVNKAVQILLVWKITSTTNATCHKSPPLLPSLSCRLKCCVKSDTRLIISSLLVLMCVVSSHLHVVILANWPLSAASLSINSWCCGLGKGHTHWWTCNLIYVCVSPSVISSFWQIYKHLSVENFLVT